MIKTYIDYLKVLGLFLIILAHTCSNNLIMQIRTFDVPLMVFISGYLAYDSYKKLQKEPHFISKYYKKRIMRLYLPVVIFLSFYFIFFHAYSFRDILRSYMLLDGIGYVWIIRVYLLCAFSLPFIFKLDTSKFKFLILTILYLSYEFFVFKGLNILNPFNQFILAYLVPYGVIYALGLFTRNLSKMQNLKCSGIFLTIFLLCLFFLYYKYGIFKGMNSFKYPPRLYYLSYALFWIYLLLFFFKGKNLKANKFISFISHSSLWIYLWHILFLNLSLSNHWLVRYILVLILAVLVTYIQNIFLDFLIKKGFYHDWFKVFRG